MPPKKEKEKKEDIELAELLKNGKDVENTEGRDAYFVINCPTYVHEPDQFSDSTSDGESPTSEFTEEEFKNPPFYIGEEVGVVSDIDQIYLQQPTGTESRIVYPFLKQLESTAGTQNLAIVIGLNRARSLSNKQNQLLVDELKAHLPYFPPFSFTYKIFGFFWDYTWHMNPGKEVTAHEKVQRFYRQFKMYCKSSDPKKLRAIEFRKELEKYINEKGTNIIPYQDLRERIKNHPFTEELVKAVRFEHKMSDVYLSIIDSDIVNFNSVYRTYIETYKSREFPPLAMSTGYEFSDDIRYYKEATIQKLLKNLKFASQLDRGIRIKVAKHIPFGVYYPEPNTCILVPRELYKIHQSFINRTRSGANQGREELLVLLKRIQETKPQGNFIFIEKSPVIIIATNRFFYREKQLLSFSPEFNSRPSEQDLINLREISQSHFNPRILDPRIFNRHAIGLSVGRSFMSKLVCPLFRAYQDRLFGHKDVDIESLRQNLKGWLEEKNPSDKDKALTATLKINDALTDATEFIKSMFKLKVTDSSPSLQPNLFPRGKGRGVETSGVSPGAMVAHLAANGLQCQIEFSRYKNLPETVLSLGAKALIELIGDGPAHWVLKFTLEEKILLIWPGEVPHKTLVSAEQTGIVVVSIHQNPEKCAAAALNYLAMLEGSSSSSSANGQLLIEGSEKVQSESPQVADDSVETCMEVSDSFFNAIINAVRNFDPRSFVQQQLHDIQEFLEDGLNNLWLSSAQTFQLQILLVDVIESLSLIGPPFGGPGDDDGPHGWNRGEEMPNNPQTDDAITLPTNVTDKHFNITVAGASE